MKVLMLSHGKYAEEVYNTGLMIMGNVSDVDYLTLAYGDDLEQFKAKIKEKIDSNDELLILCDLFGGSPFMTVSQLLSLDNNESKVEVVTGLNLPMFLEVASNNVDCEDCQSLKQIAVEAGKKGVIDLKEKLKG